MREKTIRTKREGHSVMFYLSKELFDALRKYSYEKDENYSDILRVALAEKLKKESYLRKDAQV